MSFINKYRIEIFILLFASLFFLSFLGRVHLFDWDEINFAECAREMILLNNYTGVHVDYLPFYQKPPFFFWLQSLAMHIFGINEFSARFPNAIFGALTLVMLYKMGHKLYNKKFSLIWVLAYFGSILPNFYFNFGIIDPVFNFFIFLSLYLFVLFVYKQDKYDGIELRKNKLTYLVLSAIACGFAILTKGPVAYLILIICFFVYWLFQRLRLYIKVYQFIIYTSIALFVSIVWVGVETAINGSTFITEFMEYNYRLFSSPGAGHGGFFGYHFVIILFGCFPASIFMLKSFSKQKYKHKYQKDFKLWMVILLGVVLVLFSITKSKIIHYSSMAYFPVTYLGTLVIYNIIEKKIVFSKLLKVGLIIVGSLFSLVLILLPFIGKNISIIKNYTNNQFAKANMDAQVNWSGYEAIIGVILFISVISGIYFMKNEKMKKGLLFLFLGTAITTKLILVVDAYKVEQYSQGAAITFFEGLENEDCYVTTVGYKSYAPLFYTKKKRTTNQLSHDIQWLLHGEIDKTVYFVTKIHKEELLSEHDHLEKIDDKNGFVFYKRIPTENENKK